MRPGHERRISSWALGLGLVVVIAIASVLAYTKELPWSDKYEVHAVFESAQSVRPSSPVRIAGVNVGEVTEVKALSGETSKVFVQADDEGSVPDDGEPNGEQAAVVTMELEESALPLHTDATFKLRPRLFLEGNYFVDLQPGSPNAEKVEEGHTFPVNQTSYSVQLDTVLTTLQSDVRRDLQTFLDQFGNALVEHGGAEGFRELYRTSAPAGKYTSQVAEAFLGTEKGDLAGTIRGLGKVVRGLGRNENEVRELVTSFRTVAGSFAAQDLALGRAIEELPGALRAADPALANLNAALPSVRAFAREALPGVQSTPDAIRAATPFVSQLRRLVSEDELRGLVGDLRPTIPALASLSREMVPFMRESRALASCFNEVFIPWSNDRIQPVDPFNIYPHDAAGRVFEETGYVITGLNGIGRSGDANGQWGRVLGNSGPNVLDISPNDGPRRFALVPFPILGSMPGIENSEKPPLTAKHACETQDPPNLEAKLGNAPDQFQLNRSSLTALDPEEQKAIDRVANRIAALTKVEDLREDGEEKAARRLINRAKRAVDGVGLGAALADQFAALEKSG